MKKKIFILISFLLLTGCSVKYDLSYVDNTFRENVLLETTKEEMCGEALCTYYFDEFYKSNITINYLDDAEELSSGENLDKYTFYNKKIIDESNIYGIKLGYDFDMNYSNSYVARNLFDKIYITDNYIRAEGIKDIFSNYPYLENISISFKTDKVVANTNSDRIDNEVYYWDITKDNYLNRTIEIQMKDTVIIEVVDEEKEKDYSNIINVVFCIIGIISLISVLVIYKKIKNSNK